MPLLYRDEKHFWPNANICTNKVQVIISESKQARRVQAQTPIVTFLIGIIEML